VLIVDLAKRYGGGEVRVLDMAKLLHGQYPYAVATLAGSPLHQRLDAAKLVSLPVSFSRSDPRLLIFLLRAIRRHGYEVLDAHNAQSQFWGHLAGILGGVRTRVSTVHSSYRYEHNGSLKGWAYELVLRFNAWSGTQFVVVSEAIQTYLRAIGVPQEKISLIHNSIEPPALCAKDRDLPLLKTLGWGKEAYIVTVVARLEPVKGHTFLIEALSQLAEERPQLRCLIVGDGRARAALEAQVQRSNMQDRVHFTGFRDDVPALLRASDAFSLPSLSEGLPFALLEACAHRLPALVTEVGGMAGLFVHKESAFLVPPSDPDALSEGIRWLIDHPEEAAAMGEAASESVLRRFGAEEMISKTLAVYRQ
jgi:glycosyltransferase involved in cell wall biosynthesis